jgi:hypothetical protein
MAPCSHAQGRPPEGGKSTLKLAGFTAIGVGITTALPEMATDPIAFQKALRDVNEVARLTDKQLKALQAGLRGRAVLSERKRTAGDCTGTSACTGAVLSERKRTAGDCTGTSACT